MESNIDPAIGQQELFEVTEGSVDSHNAREDSEDHSIRDVLRLNEYVNSPEEAVIEAEASIGASDGSGLNMIGFDLSNNPDQTHSDLDLEANIVSTPITKQLSVKLVPFNPDEKPKRLGRPRKNMESLVEPSPAESSTKNHSHATVSTFRFDQRPVQGPGSRGGKLNMRKQPRGRITLGSLKKRKQMLLNFSSDSTQGNKLGVKAEESPEPSETPSVNDTSIEQDDSNGDSPPSRPKKRKIQSRGLTTTSRTTVLNSRQRTAKQLQGPLVGLYYDLYDENIMDASQNERASAESLALGYPVVPSKYASDIIYLVSYLQKFKRIIHIDNLGPQDFEEGLGIQVDQLVSEDMDRLFCKLATLVLNRKREILVTSQKQAINDLRSLSMSLGLPKRWSNSNSTEDLKPETIKVESDILDPNNPEAQLNEIDAYPESIIVPNPFFDEPDFELLGLQGLKSPEDRLVMLVTLAEWSLIASDIVKNFILDELKNHDVVIDKETYYVLQMVLKGFSHTEESKKQFDKQVSKKGKDDVPGYTDPTSDPLQHPLRLRLDELVSGDCGFHVGRFYLCWMAEADNGGLTNLRRFKGVRSNINELPNHLPSRFKLYVEDIHEMLTHALTSDGVIFENGEEVHYEISERPIWYEVASDVKLLREFINHLAEKLGHLKASAESIPSSSMLYKPVTHLRQQLSTIVDLLERYEGLKNDTRLTRRNVDYNEQVEPTQNESDEDEEEFIQPIPEPDDDDYEE